MQSSPILKTGIGINKYRKRNRFPDVFMVYYRVLMFKKIELFSTFNNKEEAA